MRLGAVGGGSITGILLFSGGVKYDEAMMLCYNLVQMKLVANRFK